MKKKHSEEEGKEHKDSSNLSEIPEAQYLNDIKTKLISIRKVSKEE